MAKIRIFSTAACPYCLALKEFLKERGFKFDDIDVAKNKEAAREMIEKSGQMGVPVVEIGGTIIIGFARQKISKLLNIKD
jgi:glutaredoxin-like YruB-family protein